jgi:alkylation response protein AidB-like acyl-CoA dehydrogenase
MSLTPLTETQQAIRQTARDFAAAEIAPHAAQWDRDAYFEPSLTVALDEDCRTQVRISTESRTNAFQVRTGEFAEEQLSVYVTARQYGSLEPQTSYVDAINRLAVIAQEVTGRTP